MAADLHHNLGQVDRILHRLHKRPRAGLHIQEDAVGPGGDLLAHDAGRNEGLALHRGGDIPQGVELFVRGGQVAGLAYHTDPHLVDNAGELPLIHAGAKAGDGFHLVHGAAGVAQAPAGHLGHWHPAGGYNGGDDQGGLIPHPTGGVFIHLDPLDGGEVHHVSGVGHGVGEDCRLLWVEASEVDCHHHCSQLVVGDGAIHHPVHQKTDLRLSQYTTIPFLLDEIVHAHAKHLPKSEAMRMPPGSQ